MVAGSFPSVEVIANDENLGLLFGKAPYALVLNPDTEIHAGMLDTLLNLMEEQLGVGISGCRLEQPGGTFATLVPDAPRGVRAPERHRQRLSYMKDD